MQRLLVWVLFACMLAGCAAPTSPATSVTAQVPVTGPTYGSAGPTATTAMMPNPTVGMSMPGPATQMMPSPTSPMMISAPTQMMPMEDTAEPGVTPEVKDTSEAPDTPEPKDTPEAVDTPEPGNSSEPENQPAVSVSGGHAYTVLVGAEDTSQGAEIEAFFPSTLHIHVGDTVTWKQNANEIHTTTFLAGQEVPPFIIPMPGGAPGAVMFNPLAAFPMGPKDGKYDGSALAGSGIMGLEQGQAPSFSLTFTKAGVYSYVCVVHAQMKMTGTVIVEDASKSIPSPDMVSTQAQKDISTAMAKVPAVIAQAKAQEKPDVKNPDGTTTHHVVVGYASGQIDLMSYFPQSVAVKPGDTVVWDFSPQDMAPHTITFLNGTDEPPVVQAIPQPSGPPFLTFDPRTALPQNPGQPLMDQGVFSSGVIDPSAPGPHSFTLKIGSITGDEPYECLLHDTEGMKGTLTLAP